MATTAGGLPYPVPTDPVAQGADAIRALAEAIDRHFLTGAFTGNTAANGVLTVTFPGAGFTSAPTVIAALQFGAGGTDFTGYLIASTNTGFTYRLFQSGSPAAAGVTARINWLAVGVPA
jgi:hypothetical protein